jgi:predicted nucleic acid-binding protein
MIIVSDTSSISNLLQIGLIDILHVLYGEITITPAVRRELYHLPDQEKQIEQIDWIKVKTPQDQGMIVQLLEEIDLGEAESIVLAMEEQAQYLIIDEYKGRMIADSYGIKIVGILGVLIQAKKKEAISAVKPHIDQLIEIGFRLDKKLIERVLKGLGEL